MQIMCTCMALHTAVQITGLVVTHVDLQACKSHVHPFILTSSVLLTTDFMTQTGTGPIPKTIQAGAHAFDIATSEPDKEILRDHGSSSDLQRLHTHSHRAHPHGLAELLVILCNLQGICTSRQA